MDPAWWPSTIVSMPRLPAAPGRDALARQLRAVLDGSAANVAGSLERERESRRDVRPMDEELDDAHRREPLWVRRTVGVIPAGGDRRHTDGRHEDAGARREEFEQVGRCCLPRGVEPEGDPVVVRLGGDLSGVGE